MGDAAAPPTSSTSQRPVRSGLPSAHPTASFWQTSFPNRLAGHRSTPELPARADVVVVGTGISGTFAVDHLLNSNSNSSTVTSSWARRRTEAETAAMETGLGLDVLVLEARTLCSAATGRNGGHLQPVIHNAPAHIIDFELRNFRHIEALVRNIDKASDAGSSNINSCDYDTTATSSSSSSPSWCDFRRLEGCLGFWNEEYFREAKRDLAAAAASVDKNKSGIPLEDYSGLARVVEDAEELGALGLRVESGAVGAIVQSVAASLSPYKLCVGVWRGLLERFEQKAIPTRTTTGSHETERTVPKQRKPSLNLQTNTPVTALERCNNDNNDDDRGGCWILHTPRGSVRARAVILATNAYTSHLLPEFAPLIRPVQAQMSALVPPPSSGQGNGGGAGGWGRMATSTRKARKLIPMSYGFMGVGDMDRVMSDYLVQNPYAEPHHQHGFNHQNKAEHGDTGKDDERVSSEGEGAGGHLMFGGGRHLAPNHGEGVWDDDFVDDRVEMYLRGLPQRLNLNLDPDLNLDLNSELDPNLAQHSEPEPENETHLAIAASWTGIIGHSSDGHPWVGALPDRADLAGVFVVAGYTGHGMTNAPLCGRGVARMAQRYFHQADVGGKMDSGMDGEGDVDVPKEYLITRERMERVTSVV
ncbi:uncharacterized protein Z519_08383 [Cladophialophora bantiana CBS 173.52]|uniref:FAD dependent oxidoreductase domain-containing protein n=1 Tax=Cladophialophora bantiana (strain ATCC 10958 / CBS 173.52 / CDC B-1940 / NIH 8579) TaxID=1442370 RepID=A0A0D2HIN3_CLAB1|nr:uncharacterized protein Z519_08383 [Cladophialophora bantiana CBS 173.52]KIW90600.1 hypothetical protein Z519_08383 [Cladophialophora bantiana CBS 173.52]